MSAQGGDRSQSLAGVLARLADPATSTRRTEQARRRLAEDPVTLALLEAGVLVLQRELGTLVPSEGSEDDDRRSLRFFELLSASRVCAAATAVGPLRVTPSHLRDRWARQRDYGEDLLAFLLWRRQWDDVMQQRLERLAPPASPEQVPVVARALAEAHLVTGALPVSSRLQLVASALAAEHPGLRRAREANHRQAARRWSQVWARCAEGVGCRPREGADLQEVASALAALTEGADLRLLATDGSPVRVEESVRLLTAAQLALVRRSFEPVPRAGGGPSARVPPAGTGPLWPRPGEVDPTDVADVLVHLTDPVAGARRTSAARHRLAHDEITAQLLQGGTGVLGQELGVVAVGPGSRVGQAATASPPRFFGLLSAAAVEAAGRSLPAGAPRPTAAQLRDRWRTQDDYVEDLLAYAAHRVRRVRQGVLQRIRDDALAAAAASGAGGGASSGAGGVPAPLEAALAAAAARVLAEVDAEGHDRLRLLLTALAAARPAVAQRLSALREQEEAAVTALVAELLAGTGAVLRDDVTTADLARALVALRDGLVVRALATGHLGEREGGSAPSLARIAVEVVAGCLTGP
ncbi:hypothetical protein [Quadrisphaera sp. KR29]|uniref:hypothetical protein n=1 Tax=Quadrisphaera sp. KR29 TaxID=3461391 RepID=UPI004043C542